MRWKSCGGSAARRDPFPVGSQDAQASEGGDVSLAVAAGLGAMVVLVSAAGATYAVKRVRRED